MSESRVEQDVEPMRASRIRCKESKKGSSQHLGNSACLIEARAIKATPRSQANLSSDRERGDASPPCAPTKNGIRLGWFPLCECLYQPGGDYVPMGRL